MTRSTTGTWAAMSVSEYRLLLYSATIVIFGVMGQAVARGWLARELTGSNAGVGGVLLAFGASMLVTTPLGGVSADRYSKRLVLLLAVLALMISSFAIGLAVVIDAITYWMLLAAAAVQAAAFAFYLPARIALISEVVPSDLLQNAIVLSQMSQEAMRVVAPALAGVLIGVAWCGVGGVFIAAGIASAVSLVFVVALPVVASRPVPTRSVYGEIRDVVSYARTNSDVGMIALLTIGVVMVGFPYLAFLPTLAADRYDVGAMGFGLMSAVAGFGALTAGVIDASHNRARRPWRTIGCSGVAFGAGMIALGFADSFGIALVALAAIGASALVFQTSTQSLMLRISALEYHGRLQSMLILGFSGYGLAALPLGMLADAVSLRFALSAMGIVAITMTTIFSIVRYRHRRTGIDIDIG